MTTPLIERFCRYLDDSPTPNHAVATTVAQLRKEGFKELDLGEPPEKLPVGTRGYVAKGGSLVAFHIGTEPVQSAGYRIISAHTDSPNLRLKPQPYVRSHGYVRLGVEVYGGAIQATWTDRDLGMAGLITVRTPSGGLAQHLVNLDQPLCRIPNIAIHLNRDVNSEGLKVNAQKHLPAVFSLEIEGTDDDPLRELLGAQVGVSPEDILTWDLSLYDLSKAAVTGAHGEFLNSARLDNLASCHAGLEALLHSVRQPTPPKATSILALFDHEEIGSHTSRGADSRTLGEILRVIIRNQENKGLGTSTRALAHSWLVSADMAHAVHPAWAEMHDASHMPKIGQGPVIKQNANKRYGTEGDTAAMFMLLAEKVDAKIQWFVNRSDLRCGSTVGPILASRLGVRTIDVGNPMLSMHSCREMCGTADHPMMVDILSEFLRADSLA